MFNNMEITYSPKETKPRPPSFETNIKETKEGGVEVRLNGLLLLSVNPYLKKVFWYNTGREATPQKEFHNVIKEATVCD